MQTGYLEPGRGQVRRSDWDRSRLAWACAFPPLIAFGSDAHKQRYVQKAMMGEEIWCQLFSEPAAGSDVAGLKTRGCERR